MLHRISADTLKKAAIYGAALSVAGSSLLYYQIQKNLAKGPYYTEAVKALRNHKQAMSLLGEPIRIQALRLGDKENKITIKEAQVLIPVSGSKAAGYLRSKATFQHGVWELDSVELEFKGRPYKLTIINKKNN